MFILNLQLSVYDRFYITYKINYIDKDIISM